MNILIAVKGTEGEHFFRQAAALSPLREAADLVLAHVIDSGPHSDLELGRERFWGRRGLGKERRSGLAEAEEGRARAAVQFARQALVVAGVSEACMREVMLRGRPNEALRDLALEVNADLIVIHGRSGKPGPHSVGKTAKFLIDHCRSGALLLR